MFCSMLKRTRKEIKGILDILILSSLIISGCSNIHNDKMVNKFGDIIEVETNKTISIGNKEEQIFIEVKDIVFESSEPAPIDDLKEKSEFGVNLYFNIKKGEVSEDLFIGKYSSSQKEAKINWGKYTIILVNIDEPLKIKIIKD